MKIVIVFIFIFKTLSCLADDVGLLSTTQKEVTDGDLVTLRIIDTRSVDYYSRYKNKRIGDLVYVLDLKEKDGELYFDTIVSKAGPKEKRLELSDKFILKGLNYYPSKRNQLKDFITLNIPIKIHEKIKVWAYVLLVIIIIAIGLWWYSKSGIRKREKKLKKMIQEKNEQLLDLVTKANSQADLSTIYVHRKEIEANLELDVPKFKKIMNDLDAIQYQKEWPKEEYNKIQKSLRSIKEEIKVKSGV